MREKVKLGLKFLKIRRRSGRDNCSGKEELEVVSGAFDYIVLTYRHGL